MKEAYAQWSEHFKSLKTESKSPKQSDIDDVIHFYKTNPPPKDGIRLDWKHDFGFRKDVVDGADRGEQKIERLLLPQKGRENTIRIEKSNHTFEVIVTEQNFPFAAYRRGQVISDLFGYYKKGAVCHPVAIEVKVRNGTPWFAVVENLVQIRMARRNLKNIDLGGHFKSGQEGSLQNRPTEAGTLDVVPVAVFSGKSHSELFLLTSPLRPENVEKRSH